MNALIFLLITLFLLGGCSHGTEVAEKAVKAGGFCGISTEGPCQNDADCQVGGCSKHICFAQSEGDPITTCEYRDCYDAAAFGVECGCVEGKCRWH